MKDIYSYFRLGVGSLIQFYLKLDMAKRICLNKNYDWPSFANHRYSHGPNVKTVSWHNLNSPTNCLKPPFYGNYRHKAIQDAKFQVIRSIIFEVPRYRLTVALLCFQAKKLPGGNSWYFRTGVCHHKVSTSTLSGIFDEKVGPFSEFLCLMEVSKVRFWGLFWEKMASIFKKFSKIVDF